jgi:hypothetical protein
MGDDLGRKAVTFIATRREIGRRTLGHASNYHRNR